MMHIVIGARGSALALTQTNWVAEQIKLHNPGVETRIEIIRTKGDKILDTPLAKIGDKGLFVKEIETALAAGRIDVAVHSMKDLPTEMTPGLAIGAVPARVDPSDVLLSNKGALSELPIGARIGSSSLRRKAQLMAFRADLDFRDLRGNLDTRIRKLQTGEYDAIVLAFAGLHRLKFDEGADQRVRPNEEAAMLDMGPHPPMEKIPFDICLPAVGQGALAVQMRQDDDRMAGLLSELDDAPSRAAVTAERSLLATLGGGCQTPIAAVAVPDGENLVLTAMVASLDGTDVIRAEATGKISEAAALGEKVASALIDSGAREILEEVRAGAAPSDMGAA